MPNTENHKGNRMHALLAVSRGIDALNLRVGRAVTWITLLVVLVSAGNAVVRKVFEMSSNAWLELQWYMFGAMFLLTAGRSEEHTSELQSLMRSSYAVFCLKKTTNNTTTQRKQCYTYT